MYCTYNDAFYDTGKIFHTFISFVSGDVEMMVQFFFSSTN